MGGGQEMREETMRILLHVNDPGAGRECGGVVAYDHSARTEITARRGCRDPRDRRAAVM